MTLRFKWFSRMVPPGFKLVYSFTGWPRPGWSLWRGRECIASHRVSLKWLRECAWSIYRASLPLPEVQE